MEGSIKRLLVIDDDPKIRALLSDVFSDRYDVETALLGVDGLGLLLRRRPDVILLDINMPRMNGLEVLRDIKRLDERVPVIVITGSRDIGTAEEALKNGAFAYLPKPFQLQYVEHVVAAALADSRAR